MKSHFRESGSCTRDGIPSLPRRDLTIPRVDSLDLAIRASRSPDRRASPVAIRRLIPGLWKAAFRGCKATAPAPPPDRGERAGDGGSRNHIGIPIVEATTPGDRRSAGPPRTRDPHAAGPSDLTHRGL